MKTPEEALHEMMPVDVVNEGKGYIERVPKYVMRNTPDAVKHLPGVIAARCVAVLVVTRRACPRVPDAQGDRLQADMPAIPRYIY